MDKTNARVTTCAKSLELLADFWVLRIIETLTAGKQRYCEIQRAVGNVNPTTLTKKLTSLEKAGVISRLPESGSTTVFYELTNLGKNALPVIDAIKSFSSKFEKAHQK
jgi:DNA-binding HxlR family transcriptional regulator